MSRLQRIHLLRAPHPHDEQVIALFDFDVHPGAPFVADEPILPQNSPAMLVEPRWSWVAVMLVSTWSPASPAGDISVPGTDFLKITAVAPGYGGRPASDNRWFIYLEGYIDNGASERLERVLGEERIRSAVVYFDSPGGHVVEAMALGRVLRKRGYASSVGIRAPGSSPPRAGRCYSACPIAYAGGVQRTLGPGSVIGTHRAANSVPVADENAFQKTVTVQVRDYLVEMGISPELVTVMSGVPHDAIRELTSDEAVRLGLVNAGTP